MPYRIPDNELAMLEGMQEPMKSALINMLTAGGGRIHVSSGVRSNARQQQLWANALRKYGDPEIADNWVARPGTSNHEHGWAVDITGDKAWAHQVAGDFGMGFPLGNEDWHMEWAGEHRPGSAVAGPGGQWQGGVMYDLNYTDPTAAQDPQDVLANRLHSVLSIIGLDPASAGPGVTVMDANSPTMDVLAETPEIASPTGDVPDQSARFSPAPTQLGGMVEGQSFSSSGAPWGGGGAPPAGYVPPGEGVERWRPIALAALRYTGQDESNIDSLMRRMNQESGGRNEVVNNWDSNAQRGDPTIGLMQNIRSAFNSRAAELAGRGITDGFANIVASIRYATQRYGSLRAAYDRRGGY